MIKIKNYNPIRFIISYTKFSFIYILYFFFYNFFININILKNYLYYKYFYILLQIAFVLFFYKIINYNLKIVWSICYKFKRGTGEIILEHDFPPSSDTMGQILSAPQAAELIEFELFGRLSAYTYDRSLMFPLTSTLWVLGE